MSKVREATLSGESITTNPSGIIYRVYCPECEGPQWHKQGIKDCVYCDTPLAVHPFKVISNPDVSPEVNE